jgi:hypothetical protein
MSDEFYFNMYTTDDTTAPPPKASKVLGGLKLSGSHIQKLELADQKIDIPSVAYVKLLEQQIRELRNELRTVQTQLKRAVSQQQKLIDHMNIMKIDLNNKVDMKF